MTVERKLREYHVAGELCESLEVSDASIDNQPGLLLFPNFLGTKEWDFTKAEQFAKLGFKVLVVDMYGKGRRGFDRTSGTELLDKLTSDRRLMLVKLRAHHEELLRTSGLRHGKIAAAGYCLGGKCVLDLARSGAEVAGVVYHGLYDPPPFPNAQMLAELIVFHGWNDPFCPPDKTLNLANELAYSQIDWQFVAYGNTGHAFTNDDLVMNKENSHGYNYGADKSSWNYTVQFLSNAFKLKPTK